MPSYYFWNSSFSIALLHYKILTMTNFVFSKKRALCPVRFKIKSPLPPRQFFAPFAFFEVALRMKIFSVEINLK